MGERLFITFALTGRRFGFYVTQGVALGSGLVGPSARAWPLTIVLWTCWAFSPCCAAKVVIMLAPRPSLIDKHITTNPSIHMKKSLLLIILFLLYQVLAAVMAQVWTYLNGSGAAEVAEVSAMPSATSIGVSMLVSMALVLSLLFALRLIRRCPWRSSLDDAPQMTATPGDTTLAATLCPPKKWQAKIVKGRPVSVVGWGMALVGFVVLSLGTSLMLSPVGMDDRGMQKIFEGMKDSGTCLFLMAVAGPVFEEIVFREGVLRQLVHSRRRNDPTSGGLTLLWATVVSALCFGLVHGNLQQAVPAFILGLALGLCYCRTGNIVMCSVLHVVNNSMAVGLMFLPQLNDAMENLPTPLSVGLGLLCVVVGALMLIGMYLAPVKK